MRLLLLRHLPVRLPAGLCYGASDVEARSATAAECVTLRKVIGSAKYLAFSSPLQRCAVLARQLGLAHTFDSRLQEIDFGAWEMRAWDDIERAQIDAWAAAPWSFCPPGGESAHHMRDRVLAAWADALQQAQREGVEQLIFVTHGGPLRVLRGHLLDLPQGQWLDWSCAPGGWLCLRQAADLGWHLEA